MTRFRTHSPPPTMPDTRETSEDAPPDPWSLQFAKVAGISLRAHFSLLLMLIYFGVTRRGMIFFIIGLLFCILLHELGHALTARKFGYPMRRITLYPIGGVAAIEDNPKPRHEFWIAVAGPAVNVVIVTLLAIAFQLRGTSLLERLQSVRLDPDQFLSGGDTLALLAFANLSLVLFNLIPAFPMDGGRVLRSLLAMKMGELRATAIAARIGQALAIVGGIWGLFTGHFTLVLIAMFVFFGAGQELQGEATRGALDGAKVGEAMVTSYATLPPGATLDEAAQLLLATSQTDFPVVLGSDIHGVLSRDSLLRGLAERGKSTFVSEVMVRDFLRVSADDNLEPFLLRGDGLKRAPLAVVAPSGDLLGLVTQDNVMEYIVLRRIADARAEGEPA
jgi:Zn-dependent protease/CBS domain-containing protein